MNRWHAEDGRVIDRQGMANKQIARELSISLRTAKFHVSLHLKLNASNRTETVLRGLITFL
jgi:DNA-binding NarL/FixJ family response regulator